MTHPRPSRLLPLSLLAALLPACSNGGSSGDGARPPEDPPVTSTVLQGTETCPGVVVDLIGVSGGSNSDGSFRPGDHVEVRFRLEKDDGSPWGLGEMSFSSALISGPAFNYQRVVPEVNDLVARAAKKADGSYSYRFEQPLPQTYLPPYNDSPTFDALYGELTGQDLLAGTYTVGVGFAWNYTADGKAHVASGEATFDFALGGGTVVDGREVTTQAHCNQCHSSFSAHDGLRTEVAMCVLCHTAGAEDLNDPTIAGGTPDVTIDSKVLFHKIHNGAHLPSVVGIGLKNNGSLKYNEPSVPYQVIAADGTIHDYSEIDFPVFPNRSMPTLRDFGHKSLGTTEKGKEDLVRTGMSSCHVCHGQPEGVDPGHGGGHGHMPELPPAEEVEELEAPEDGNLVYIQPTINACVSCHDDWDPLEVYQVNLQSMPVQPDNAGCTECHPGAGGPLSIVNGHLHPLDDPAQHRGLHVTLNALTESGNHDGDGTIDVGEELSLNFEIHDHLGASVTPGLLTELRVIVSGPTSNPQVVLDTTIPPIALTTPPFTIDLPETVPLEHVGTSTSSSGEVFGLARSPNLSVAAVGGAMTLYARSSTAGGASTLVATAYAPETWLDVVDASGFARGDHVVVDDGLAGLEEYLEVQLVEGNRLWFSPASTVTIAGGLRNDHAIGASVLEVQLTPKVSGVDYTMDPVSGTITELVEFGAGTALVATYTSDFVLPATYPAPFNASPDLGERAGDWGGKPIVDGTYTLTFVARQHLSVAFFGEVTDYEILADPATLDLLVGSATQIVPYDKIMEERCDTCHQEVYYHEDRFRGYTTCIACHGGSGSGDLSRAVAGNAPATPGRDVAFRELIHALHRGKELHDPTAFEYVGAGAGAYPDNFEVESFATHGFPSQPAGTQDCMACHEGGSASWTLPTDRDHPLGQLVPVQEWRSSCLACHDDPTAVAHMDSNTAPSGAEACAICHAPGEDNAVDVEHLIR